ncbi:MAG: phosphotransferase, partial [Pseudomonadota bacterium]
MNVDDSDVAFLRAQVAAQWDLSPEEPLTRLDGEHDLNIAVGDRAILKVMRPGCERAFVDMQIAALAHCAISLGVMWLPHVIATRDDATVVSLTDEMGEPRLAWMMSRCKGRAYADVSVRSMETIRAVGVAHAQLSVALARFEHPSLQREIKWDLLRPLWARGHLELVRDDARRGQLAGILDVFERDVAKPLGQLPAHAIHNDLNDYNILVRDRERGGHDVTGLIDFGDMIAGPRICDVAIAAAYLMLDQPRPLEALGRYISGFCSVQPLDLEELDLLWPLLQTRLAVSALNAADVARAKPADPYVLISQAPIVRLLNRLPAIDPMIARGAVRQAAGYAAVAHGETVVAWLAQAHATFAPIFDAPLRKARLLDLSVAGDDAPDDPISLDRAQLTR